MPTAKSFSAIAPWFARMCGALQNEKGSPHGHSDMPKPMWTKPASGAGRMEDHHHLHSHQHYQPQQQQQQQQQHTHTSFPRQSQSQQQQQQQQQLQQQQQQQQSQYRSEASSNDRNRSASYVSSSSENSVPIDADTNVPYDLYRDFLRAGRQAKARGQHELQEYRGVKAALRPSQDKPKMHLVRTSPAW
eukprot:CAMPEP_0206465470 /NCGR_PEP_ID=MMETSP0324_2-20121206/27853_1 /ASSEMBLY_ACC=CAM_ASM_000836 /TAXON_ID=2866 /ORGANISM="Crypthecodinium cohnii, Strain Seligo" /LENGTH=188 /DNA_ID=CAMNT_0053938343 /DNA_START=43 /DNA_END=609 /DNA_ORIENTATION=-